MCVGGWSTTNNNQAQCNPSAFPLFSHVTTMSASSSSSQTQSTTESYDQALHEARLYADYFNQLEAEDRKKQAAAAEKPAAEDEPDAKRKKK